MSPIASSVNERKRFENDSFTTTGSRAHFRDHSDASMKREDGSVELTYGFVSPTDSFTWSIVRFENPTVV
jgi:hypothetical protein